MVWMWLGLQDGPHWLLAGLQLLHEVYLGWLPTLQMGSWSMWLGYLPLPSAELPGVAQL